MSAIERAIEIAGGPAELAERIGLGRKKIATVSNWRLRKQVPPERCRAIEAATNKAVTRYELRPDVFGDDPALRSPDHNAEAT